MVNKDWPKTRKEEIGWESQTRIVLVRRTESQESREYAEKAGYVENWVTSHDPCSRG